MALTARIDARDPTRVVVVVAGVLTDETGERLAAGLRGAQLELRRANGGTPTGTILADLRGLRLVDEGGAASLERALEAAREAGAEVVVLKAPDYLQLTLRLLGLEDRFAFIDDEESPLEPSEDGDRRRGTVGTLLVSSLSLIGRALRGARRPLRPRPTSERAEAPVDRGDRSAR